nr:TIGR00730 family Rossman fold protein [Rhodoflexus caldus]
MKSICVYCGANSGVNPVYIETATAVGSFIANHHMRLVYGGGRVGMMGAVADEVLRCGGKVTGIIPDFLLSAEVGHTKLNELVVVKSMHERKTKMFEISDGFLALPGGMGTFEELCEILTWAQLGLHQKPIGVLNVNGYYDKLLDFLDYAVQQGFYKPEYRAMLLHDSDMESLYQKMLAYSPSGVQKIMKDRSKI